jgi:hypothetical protein
VSVMEWRKRWKNDLRSDQKQFILMESGELLNRWAKYNEKQGN